MRESVTPRIARIAPWAVLALGFGAFLLYAAPGYMSTDSAQQLLEARSATYSDWHPPAMAALWRIVEHVCTGPLGMLLLQSTALLAGAYRLLRRQLRPLAAALFAVGLLLFPPVLAPMAVIWKDSQMAGYLLLGFALATDERPRTRALGVVVLAVATAMRANSPAATLPLFALAFAWRTGVTGWKRAAAAVGVWLVITAGAFATNRALTDNPQHAWHVSIAPADIAGILPFCHRYSDAELHEVLAGTPLIMQTKIQYNARRNYNPVSWWGVLNGPDRMFDWATTDDQRTALTRAWRTLVLGNPLSYLDHRARVFREVIGLSGSPPFDPVCTTMFPGSYGPPLHYDATARPIQDSIGAALMWIATETFLFRAYPYLAIAFVVLVLGWRYRDIRALIASGICFELSLLPFAPSPDVRYSHWLITTTVLTTVLLVARRYGLRAQVIDVPSSTQASALPSPSRSPSHSAVATSPAGSDSITMRGPKP